jgi:hypothetical protein
VADIKEFRLPDHGDHGLTYACLVGQRYKSAGGNRGQREVSDLRVIYQTRLDNERLVGFALERLQDFMAAHGSRPVEQVIVVGASVVGPHLGATAALASLGLDKEVIPRELDALLNAPAIYERDDRWGGHATAFCMYHEPSLVGEGSDVVEVLHLGQHFEQRRLGLMAV